MLETIISSTSGESFTLINAFIVIISSIVLRLLIIVIYMNTNKDTYSSSFTTTLLALFTYIGALFELIIFALFNCI